MQHATRFASEVSFACRFHDKHLLDMVLANRKLGIQKRRLSKWLVKSHSGLLSCACKFSLCMSLICTLTCMMVLKKVCLWIALILTCSAPVMFLHLVSKPGARQHVRSFLVSQQALEHLFKALEPPDYLRLSAQSFQAV